MNLNKFKNKAKWFKSRSRFSIKLITLFSSSLILALSVNMICQFNISSNNQNEKFNNNQLDLSSSLLSKKVDHKKNDFSNVVIRTNPINNFSGINISSTNNSKNCKLVLSTVKTEKETLYGVALIDQQYNVLSNWLLSDIHGIDTSLNYTTNIIQGSNENTFFVLASISNLAKALNNVYSYYDSSSNYFDDVVKTNLDNAPSIKIFKINVLNDNISSDIDNPYYDFPYPDFSDPFPPGPIKQYAGLLFFDRLGLFYSNKNQQDVDNHIYYGAGGYYQYLFYGQLFAYNYDNLNEDQFALISSQLGPDPEIGNLYAYYNKKYKSCVSALDNDMFFNDQLSSVFWNIPSDFHHAYEFNDKYKSTKKLAYTIQYQDGHIGNVSDDDALTSTAAISIAFMMDFAIHDPVPFDNKIEIHYPNIMHHEFDWVHHNTYLFTPGWFLFSPRTSSIKYSFFVNQRDLRPLDIWFHVVSTTYDKNTKNYYSLLAGPGYLYENICQYLYCKFNYFENINSIELYDAKPIISSRTNKIADSYTTDQQTNIPIFSKPFVGKFFVEDKIVIFFDGATYNNEKWGIFVDSKFYWIRFIDSDIPYSTPTLINFTYDNESKILSYFDNENIYSVVLNNEFPTTKVIVKKFLMSLNSFTFISTGSMLDKNLTYSFDGINKIEATWYQVNDLLNKKKYYYIAESNIDKDNNSKIIDTLDWYEVGHSELKNDNDFTSVEKNQSIKELLNKNPSDLKKLFQHSERVPGTSKEVENRGLLIIKVGANEVGIAEIIYYKNQLMISFANKHDSSYFELSIEYPFYANYENVFKPSNM